MKRKSQYSLPFVAVALALAAPPALAQTTPQEHAMCAAVVLVAQMAHDGSGVSDYWTKEAERVLDATVAAYQASGLKGQKGEDAAFAEVARIRDIIAEDLVKNYTDGLFECHVRGLITLK